MLTQASGISDLTRIHRREFCMPRPFSSLIQALFIGLALFGVAYAQGLGGGVTGFGGAGPSTTEVSTSALTPSISAVNTFLEYDYAETRDLLKSFLTLISATLGLSVAFSDKIAGPHFSDHIVQRSMLLAWISFFISLALAGASIVLIAASAGCAIYGVIPLVACGGWQLALWSWSLGLLAALVFGLGLFFLTATAWRSMKLSSAS